MTHGDVATVMAQLGRRLEAAPGISDALQVVVDLATGSIDGIDHAGISLLRGAGTVETAASSGRLVERFDELQYTLGQGPCLDALDPQAPPVVVANRIEHDLRWPAYVPEAVKLGLTAQAASRLSPRGRVHGSLNLYATGTEELGPTALRLAELFAVHASLVLDRARTESNLHAALDGRHLIGQALGIVRERYGMTEEQAMAYLIRLSSRTGTQLRVVAKDLTDSVRDDPPAP